jgi:hypothetical protein
MLTANTRTLEGLNRGYLPRKGSFQRTFTAPDAEATLRLTILPLIQVAAVPRLMVRPPEPLVLSPPRSILARHTVLSIFKSKARTDRVGEKMQNKCAKMDAYKFPAL